ncbi:hypothetical protein [Streptomyces sp. NPDC055036]
MKFKSRTTTLLAMSALVVSSALFAGAGSASAVGNYSHATLYTINSDGSQSVAGQAIWSKDPTGSDPGDALRATDMHADGYGIVAHLSTGRKASTAGHNSPYKSPWVTGNLTEGNSYQMWACFISGGVEFGCGTKITVTA